MFLCSECLDVRKTAQQIVKYFDSKRLLFGESKLVTPITYNDLDEDDKIHIRWGSFYILQSKDQAGRPVIFVNTKQVVYKSW